MSKRALQVCTGVLGLIPIVSGAIGMMGVHDPFYVAAGVPHDLFLDSNLRFFSGVWIGLGLALLWLIPRIDTQTTLFRIFWGMIFLGGLGRLLSMLALGLPPLPVIAFTALEIIGAPLFIYWQSRIQRPHAHA